MKVEIKEAKKERENGWYRVIISKSGNNAVARFKNGKWLIAGIEDIFFDNDFSDIDESPIIFGKEFTETKPKLEPFELSLIIESKEELQELWYRIYMTGDDVNSIYNNKVVNNETLLYILENKLEEIMEERNIKP